MPDVVSVRLNFYKVSPRLQLFDKLFAALVSVETRELARVFVHCAVVVHYSHGRKVMAKPDLEVVRVVRGSDFNHARAEFHIRVLVADDGYGLIDYRQNNVLAD